MTHALRLRALAVAALLAIYGFPASAQDPTWPNLATLTNYTNPSGTTCRQRGAAAAGTEKARTNTLKNRFRLPADGFEVMKLSAVMALPSGTFVNPPTSADPLNSKAVEIIGYVNDVKRGGTSGESCNCKATAKRLVDVHIDIVLDPLNNDDSGRNMVVAEITERIRRLASEGLLESNIGNDWSYTNLRARLLGRWVRFKGWLFYDRDHHGESWKVDPANNKGSLNWRATAWELHPVMAIEAGVPRPTDN